MGEDTLAKFIVVTFYIPYSENDYIATYAFEKKFNYSLRYCYIFIFRFVSILEACVVYKSHAT